MTTYDIGYKLGIEDIKKHGAALAVDKLELLEGDLQKGYHDALKGTHRNLTPPRR